MKELPTPKTQKQEVLYELIRNRTISYENFNYMQGYRPLLITFSGGRTSAFMARLLLELPKYKNSQKLIVFANTGRENEATLKFVNECDKRWNLNVVWLEADVNEEKGK